MRTATTLLLFACCLTCRAQDAYLSLWGGAVAGRINLPSFEEFRTSYNKVNANSLDSELGGFGMTLGWQAGATVMLTPHLGLSLGWLKHTTKTSGTLDDGSTRHFKHEFYTPINGGVVILAGPLEIHPRLGFCQANLRSWTEYADGTASYGNERLLNGMFRTYGLFAGIDLAARIDLSEKLHLAVGASWCGVSGSDYSEPNIARGVDTEPVYPGSIPTDWEQWLELSAANELTGYDVKDYVMLKGSWYHAFLNLVIDLK